MAGYIGRVTDLSDVMAVEMGSAHSWSDEARDSLNSVMA